MLLEKLGITKSSVVQEKATVYDKSHLGAGGVMRPGEVV